jgi:uncharacterized protein (DUF736 family)
MTKFAAYVPTEKDRGIVQTFTACGATQKEIAGYLRVTEKTLRKYYRVELDTGAMSADMQVARSLFRNATERNDTTAQIFWMKTKRHWRTKEPIPADDVASKADAKPATLKLPENTSDPVVAAKLYAELISGTST